MERVTLAMTATTVTLAIIEAVQIKILKFFILNKIYLFCFNILLFDIFSKSSCSKVATDRFVKIKKKLCFDILSFDNFILLKLKF